MAGNGNGVFRDEEAQLGGFKVQPISSILMNSGSGHTNSNGDKDLLLPTTLADKLGIDELFSLPVWRASMWELVGTAVLVFMVDTIVISTYQTGTKSPNLIIAVLVALTVTVVVMTGLPISGGHINPVVTLAAALVGLISMSRALVYIVAQCFGAILGALALKAVVSNTVVDAYNLGGCTLTVIAEGPNGPVEIGLEIGQALSIEILCTFVLLFGPLWMAFDSRRNLSPLMISCMIATVVGLDLFVSTALTGQKGYAGAGMNPARCLGPALVRGGHLWKGHWVFWAGPTIACFAFYLYFKIIPKESIHSHGFKYDFINLVKSS